MFIGIGIDLVDVERFRRHLERTPELLDRIFHEAERSGPAGALPWYRLAETFAIKEAAAKALGVPAGIDWRDCVVSRSAAGAPQISLRGPGAAAATHLGVTRWHLSFARVSGVAIGYALAERIPVA